MRRARWFAVGACAIALGVAGCGGDDAPSNSSAGDDTAAPAAADGPTVEAPPTTPPSDIPATQALAKVPPKGKSFIYLQCELPQCALTAGGVKEATSALGWTSKVQVFKNSDPGAGLQQAIQAKPDYIGITGIPVPAMKPQLAEAERAGIPVLSCGTTDQPSAGGYAIQCGGTLERDGEYLGRWITNDSGGKANVLAVSIPQFSALVTITDWFKQDFASLCSSCKFDELDVTVDDVGAGGVPSKLTAYLQTHPDINYVLFTFADLQTGAVQALTSAGLADKVKLVGAVANAASIQGISSGEYKAYTLSPQQYMGATMVDAAARLSVGEELSTSYLDEIYHNPTWVVDSDAEASKLASTDNQWPGPADFIGQYKTLWGLSQ